MSTEKTFVLEGESEARTVNFMKLKLLESKATSLLQLKFKERWAKHAGSDWDTDKDRSATVFINACGRKFYKNLNKSQKGHVDSGKLDSWDITLLTDILTQDNFRPGQGQDEEEKLQLKQLKDVRNTLAHSPDPEICDQDFKEFWIQAELVVLFLGGSVGDIEQISSCKTLADIENQNKSKVDQQNSEKAEGLKKEGNELHQRTDFEGAIEAYTKAIELPGLSPIDLGILYSNRSASYFSYAGKTSTQHPAREGSMSRANATQCALADAKEVLRLRPAWYKGYFRAGNAYMSLRKYEKAVRAFDWALSLAPGQPEIQQARDDSRMKLGIFTRKEHLNPDYLKVLNHLVEDPRKQLEEQLGRPISNEMAKELREYKEKRIPGQADVYKGHECRDDSGADGKRDETAVQFYSKAAAVGNAEGLYNLALFYKLGRGVRQDFGMAMKLLKEAASMEPFIEGSMPAEPVVGVAEAEHALGLSYHEGVGVPQDYHEAHKWYKRACNHGYSYSANNLAHMYREGKGVKQDMKKAGQYWHLAASQKNSVAMESLAYYYVRVEKNVAQAKHWYEQAIAHGNLNAKLHREEFYSQLAKVDECNKNTEEVVGKWETSEDLEVGMLSLDDRVRRWQMGTYPELTCVIDNLQQLFVTANAKAKTPERPTHCFYDPEILAKFAERGSETARIFSVALTHFYSAMKLYFMGLSKSRWPLFCHEMAECCRHESLVIQLPREMRVELANRVLDFLKTLPADDLSSVDCEGRLSYGILNMFDIEETLRFAEASMRKYPDEKALYVLVSDSHAFRKDFKSALEVAKDGLERFPGDVELLYGVAGFSFLMPRETIPARQVFTEYETFLKAAPKDHRKVPQCYYVMAVLAQHDEIKIKKNRTSPRFEQTFKYYRLGLEAEKVQLPYFLPYDSPHKSLVENHFRMLALLPDSALPADIVQSFGPPIPSTSVPPPVDINGDIALLTSPTRVKVIREHRQQVALVQAAMKSRPHVYTTQTPAHKQEAPLQLAGLKPIAFRDMSMFEDKVYENCVLALQSVEDPAAHRAPSIRLVLEDENRDVCRAFVYNFQVGDGDYASVLRQRLGRGARLSIINPYMRLAADGGYGLRVDDPNTLFLHSKAKPSACRFCGKEDAKQRCAKCGTAFYCGRSCQKVDWKTLDHKLICSRA